MKKGNKLLLEFIFTLDHILSLKTLAFAWYKKVCGFVNYFLLFTKYKEFIHKYKSKMIFYGMSKKKIFLRAKSESKNGTKWLLIV